MAKLVTFHLTYKYVPDPIWWEKTEDQWTEEWLNWFTELTQGEDRDSLHVTCYVDEVEDA